MSPEIGPRVLVVGADEAQRVALASRLRAAGHAVEEAATVAAGCDILRRRRIGVVVADVEGPEAGGLAITRAARRSAPPAQAVIVLPARSESNEYALPALERDAHACLRHPVDHLAVVAAVAAALEAHTQAMLASARSRPGVSPSAPEALAAGAAARPLPAEAVRVWSQLVDTLAASHDTEALDDAAARIALELTGAIRAWSFAWDEAGRPERQPALATRSQESTEPPVTLAIEARLARRPVARPDGPRTLGAAPVPGAQRELGALAVELPPGADFSADVAAPLAALAAEVALVRRALDAERRAEEAMTVARTALRTALEAAIDEVHRHSGTQFDPRVVEAFDRVVEGWLSDLGEEDRRAAA